MAFGYLLEDGSGRLLLEDGSGIYLLEDAIALSLLTHNIAPLFFYAIASRGGRR